ncbi:hypothetical protein HDU97_002106 [Phlyctochytrium planicorne]|nr:hypothetical protein HDU97_002106 [Phlyctochytrium planicorne]
MSANSTLLAPLLATLNPYLERISPYLTYLQETYPHEFYLLLTVFLILSPLFIALVLNPQFGSSSLGGKHDVPESHKDIIVLHVYDRPRGVNGLVNLSPLCLKLETFLRVTETPYVRVTNSRMSLKGQKPYITYNGEEIADAYFCVRWLQDKFGVTLDAGLEASEKGAVEAYGTMIEEGLNWQILYFIWGLKSSWPWVVKTMFDRVPFPMNYVVPFIVRRRMLATLHAEGTSRHTRAQVIQIMESRLEALSTLLASDDYLMGTPEPSSLDCIAYAFLAKILLQNLPDPTPMKLVLRRPNLVRFVRRMSETYFADVAAEVDWAALEEAAEDEADEDYVDEEEEEDDDEDGMDEADEVDAEEEALGAASPPAVKKRSSRKSDAED